MAPCRGPSGEPHLWSFPAPRAATPFGSWPYPLALPSSFAAPPAWRSEAVVGAQLARVGGSTIGTLQLSLRSDSQLTHRVTQRSPSMSLYFTEM